MGTRTMVGHEAGSEKSVWVLFCSADGHAIGRVLPGDEDDAQAFLDWYEPQWGDPRKAEPDDLLRRQDAWVAERRHDAIRLREAQQMIAFCMSGKG